MNTMRFFTTTICTILFINNASASSETSQIQQPLLGNFDARHAIAIYESTETYKNLKTQLDAAYQEYDIYVKFIPKIIKETIKIFNFTETDETLKILEDFFNPPLKLIPPTKQHMLNEKEYAEKWYLYDFEKLKHYQQLNPLELNKKIDFVKNYQESEYYLNFIADTANCMLYTTPNQDLFVKHLFENIQENYNKRYNVNKVNKQFKLML